MSRCIPRIGFVAMALPGFLLGEEMTEGKKAEAIKKLKDEGYEICDTESIYTQESAFAAGQYLNKQSVDCLCVVCTTFIPDYFVTELVKACNKPVFIWAFEREVFCLATVCLPLITGSLYKLNKDCCAVSGDIDCDHVYHKLYDYSRSAMLKERLQNIKIGYTGYKPSIMYGMEGNDFSLDNNFGVTIYPLPLEDFYEAAKKVKEEDVEKEVAKIRSKVGCIQAKPEDIAESARFYLAAKNQVGQYNLNGYSMNCFPNLKAKICLAVSMLNDDGIGAGCEGDINSTVLMVMAHMLTGGAAFNGDFLKPYPEEQSIMFSHCGAGAFSLAGCASDICLKCSAETNSGLAVFYKTYFDKETTLVNMVLGKNGNMRISVLKGMPIPDTSGYEGTPLRLKFDGDIADMPDKLAQAGSGHHWVGIPGDWTKVFEYLSRMTGFEFVRILPD